MTITEEDVNRLAEFPLGNEIVALLKPIFDNEEFIYSILLYCKTPEQRQKLIDEIKTKNINEYRDIVHIANEINMGRV